MTCYEDRRENRLVLGRNDFRKPRRHPSREACFPARSKGNVLRGATFVSLRRSGVRRPTQSPRESRTRRETGHAVRSVEGRPSARPSQSVRTKARASPCFMERRETRRHIEPSRKARREVPKTHCQTDSRALAEAETQGSHARARVETPWYRQTRPTAQGPEVGECQRLHSPKERQVARPPSLKEYKDLRIGDGHRNDKRAGSPREGSGRRLSARNKASKGARAVGNGQGCKTRKGIVERARNTANPMIGSGVQQTRKVFCGESHQDGEKPCRWNRTCPLATAGRRQEPTVK
jgi:hypothetical protein